MLSLLAGGNSAAALCMPAIKGVLLAFRRSSSAMSWSCIDAAFTDDIPCYFTTVLGLLQHRKALVTFVNES